MLDSRLSLPELYYLLALNPETGRERGANVLLGIAGLGLAELVVRGFITETGEKTRPFRWAQREKTGVPVLDLVVERLDDKALDRRGRDVIRFLERQRGQRAAVRERLIAEGTIAAERGKIAALIPVTVYPEKQAGVRLEVIRGMRDVVESDRDVPVRLACLISITKGTGLLPFILSRSVRQARAERLRDITKTGPNAARSTLKAIEEIEVAIAGAAVMTSVSATSS